MGLCGEWRAGILHEERGHTPCGMFRRTRVVYRVKAFSEDVRGGKAGDSLGCLITMFQIIATPMMVCTPSTTMSIPTCSSQ